MKKYFWGLFILKYKEWVLLLFVGIVTLAFNGTGYQKLEASTITGTNTFLDTRGSGPITSATGTVLWTANYSADPVKFGWAIRQGASHAINLDTTIERSPGVPSLRFTVTPNDGYALGTNGPYTGGSFAVNRQSPGNDAAANLIQPVGSGGFTEGSDVYASMSLYIPYSQTATGNGDINGATGGLLTGPAPPGSVMPVFTQQSIQFLEFYGPPYNGPSPTCLGFSSGQGIGDAKHNYLYWSSPLYKSEHVWYSPQFTYDTWHDMVFHVHFSSDASLGFIEIWYDGSRQTFRDGSQTYHYASINKADNGYPDNYPPQPPSIYVMQQQYRWNIPYTLTIYWSAETKIGTSYDAVASIPTSIQNMASSNNGYSLSVAPNPISSNFKVMYHLTALTPIEFMLYDSKGELIGKQKNENAPTISGELNWTIDSKLASGVYYMIMKQKGKKVATCKLIKTQ